MSIKKNIIQYHSTIFLVISFLIGGIFGYYCGIMTKSNIASKNAQKTEQNASLTNISDSEDQDSEEPISIFSLDANIQSIDNNTITVKPSYGSEDIVYKIEVSNDTVINKTKEDFDPEKDPDVMQKISLSDLKPNNLIYIESKENIINKTTIQASYIELVNQN